MSMDDAMQSQGYVEPAKAPVCSTCNDTHWMTIGGEDSREVMCTRCPVPCQKCRVNGNGPYCTTPRCGCDCHRSKTAKVEPPKLDLAAIAARVSENGGEEDEQDCFDDRRALLDEVTRQRGVIQRLLDQNGEMAVVWKKRLDERDDARQLVRKLADKDWPFPYLERRDARIAIARWDAETAEPKKAPAT